MEEIQLGRRNTRNFTAYALLRNALKTSVPFRVFRGKKLLAFFENETTCCFEICANTTAKLIKYNYVSQLGTGTPALIFITNDLGFIGKNKCGES
ncbi:hypothetical protein, partial [Desulfonatronospira sp.]|uniref:hypothetical protein n=1 Tax=Desulfonatronospira sp. TaxID=1962951 RepID=UPI0025C39CEF